jgi:hypothetical protein
MEKGKRIANRAVTIVVSLVFALVGTSGTIEGIANATASSAHAAAKSKKCKKGEVRIKKHGKCMSKAKAQEKKEENHRHIEENRPGTKRLEEEKRHREEVEREHEPATEE